MGNPEVGGPERSARGRFPAAPASVPAARRFVGALLAGWQNDERVAEVLLCVSELTTNALVHVGGDGFEVRALVWPERVRVEIGDGCSRGITPGGGATPGAGAPGGAATAGGPLGDVSADRAAGARSHGGDDLGGRGLVLVGALADDWGVRVERASGKAVWAEFTGATDHGGGPP